jgi:predicted Zn finger-like uncharacterized protein
VLVGCPECNTHYHVDDAKIPAGGRDMRCGKCTHVFRMAPPSRQDRPGLETVGCTKLPAAATAQVGAAAGQVAAAAAGATVAMTGAAARRIPRPAPASPVAGSAPAIPRAAAPTAAPDPAVPAPAPAIPLTALPPAAPAAPAPAIPLAAAASPAPVAPPAPAGFAPGGEPAWFVAREAGEVRADRATLRDWIRTGQIDQLTPLRPAAGGDPLPAGQVPELGRYFRLKHGGRSGGAAPAAGATPAAGGFCSVHGSRPAEHVCTVCSTLYCGACAVEKEFGSARVRWCTKCDDRCVPYQGARNVVPFWREIPRLFVYPLEGWGPFMVLCCAVLSTLGAWLPGPGKVLYFFALAYQLHILAESAKGHRKLPDWPDVTDVWEITARGMKAVLVTAVAWGPVIAFNVYLFSNLVDSASGDMATTMAMAMQGASPAAGSEDDGPEPFSPASGDAEINPEDYVDANGNFDFERYYADVQAQSGPGDPAAGGAPLEGQLGKLLRAGALFLIGNLILVPLVFLYYPMCLMIAAIWNTVAPALNPALIARCIGRIKRDYAIALVFLAVLAVGGFVVQLVFSIIPLLGALVASLVGSYLTFIQMHILGWTAWQGWDRLNWDIKI